MDHYVVFCSECEKRIRQCRCPSKNKTHRYEVCDVCKKTPPQKDKLVILAEAHYHHNEILYSATFRLHMVLPFDPCGMIMMEPDSPELAKPPEGSRFIFMAIPGINFIKETSDVCPIEAGKKLKSLCKSCFKIIVEGSV